MDKLPNEILVKIFSHLEFPEAARTLSEVCAKWDELVDEYFGKDVEVCSGNLACLATVGIRKCKIVRAKDEESALENFLFALEDSMYQDQGHGGHGGQGQDGGQGGFWRRPILLKELVLTACISRMDQDRMFFEQGLPNLVVLDLSWEAFASIIPYQWRKIKEQLTSLEELRVRERSALLQHPSEMESDPILRNLLLLHYTNSLIIFRLFHNLKTLIISMPEPKTHAALTKSVITFLASSQRLNTCTLIVDGRVSVVTEHLREEMEALPFSIGEMKICARQAAVKVSSTLRNFGLLFSGDILQYDEVWMALMTSFNGLEQMQIELPRGMNVSLAVPGLVAEKNKECLEVFMWKGGPDYEVDAGIEDLSLDFGKFKACSKLEVLQLNLYDDVDEIAGLSTPPFPPSLFHLRLKNVVLCFEEILTLVQSMTKPGSILNLDKVWVENCIDVVTNYPEGEDFRDIIMGPEYLDFVKTICETLISNGKIACFTFGILPLFPVEGIRLFPGEEREQLLKSDKYWRIHIHDGVCLTYPEPPEMDPAARAALQRANDEADALMREDSEDSDLDEQVMDVVR